MLQWRMHLSAGPGDNQSHVTEEKLSPNWSPSQTTNSGKPQHSWAPGMCGRWEHSVLLVVPTPLLSARWNRHTAAPFGGILHLKERKEKVSAWQDRVESLSRNIKTAEAAPAKYFIPNGSSLEVCKKTARYHSKCNWKYTGKKGYMQMGTNIKSRC